MSKPYVDVRGPFPLLIIGMKVFELPKADRSITPEQAIKVITGILILKAGHKYYTPTRGEI